MTEPIKPASDQDISRMRQGLMFPQGLAWYEVASLDARIEADRATIAELLAVLEKAKRSHYYCDDCWYSCPMAQDGCCNESIPKACNCGADYFNTQIDAAILRAKASHA